MTSLIVLQDCATIQLSRGLNTLIDAADMATAGQMRWCAFRAHIGFYAGRPATTRRPYALLHRFLLGEPARLQVDHRNGDRLDNRRSNLRPCTASQNARNVRRTRGVSRYKGVYFAQKRWQAHIAKEDGKGVQWIGSFRVEEDAARAYDAAARKIFGEFACTNAEMYGI